VSEREDFMRYADACTLLAEDGDVARHRATLQTMAQAWRRLAAEEERIADLIREVDNLFACERAGAPKRRRPAKSALRAH
jgi:hypothetical protein